MNLTGYPHIDKPWLKYYSDEAINSPLPECTIYQYLWENNKNNLKDTAIIYFGKRITYKKLFDEIDKAACAFEDLGISSGDIVTICTMNTPEMVYITYGLNKIGAIANFEYPTLSEKELYDALRKTSSKLFIMLDLFGQKFTKAEKYADKVITISPASSMPMFMKTIYKISKKSVGKYEDYQTIVNNQTTVSMKAVNYQENRPAVLTHTGGSTGIPKGVLLCDDNFNAIAYQYKVSGMDYSRQDTILHCIPPFHAYGFSVGVHMPLSLGMTICMSIKIENEAITKLFKKYKPVHFVGTGPHVTAIMNDRKIQKSNLKHIKTIAIGGAAASSAQESAVNEFLKDRGSKSKLLIGYGMTEVCATVCTNMSHCRKAETVGIPLSRVNIKVVDIDTRKELTYNQTGELLLSTPTMMLEYYRNNEENKNAVIYDDEGVKWLKTGDLASVDEDGFVKIKGRIKRIFTTRDVETGFFFKVYPEYIEQTAEKINGVESCSVICVPDKEKINIPIAYIVRNSPSLDENKVLEYCRNTMSAHSVPQQIVFIEKMPLTPIGKVDYNLLLDMAQ